MISTALQYKVDFALQKCDFPAHFAMRYRFTENTGTFIWKRQT